MSLSMDNLSQTNAYSPKNDSYIFDTKNEDMSIEKAKKSISSKTTFYEKENINSFDEKINKDLQILNYILTPSDRISSVKTVLSDNLTEMDYDLDMVHKFNENDLSFISNFDLEEDTKDN